MELKGTVSDMPINIASKFPIINKYQYPFNDKEDTFNLKFKKFKMEILATIIQLIRQNMYMAKLNIEEYLCYKTTFCNKVVLDV